MDLVPVLESEWSEHVLRAAEALPGVWASLSTGEGLDLVGDIVSALSKTVMNSSGAILPLAPLKRHDEYTFVHTVNVAVLSTSLSEALGLNKKTVHELSVSALLHDVGKQTISKS